MNNSIQDTFHFRLTQLFALIFPICPAWSSILIVLVAVNWIIGLGFKGLIREQFKILPFILFAGFFVLYLLGLFWTKNMDKGFSELETKLSLIVLPFVFFTVPLTKDQLRAVLKSFVVGCALAMITWLLFATYNLCLTKYYISQGNKIWNFDLNFFLSAYILKYEMLGGKKIWDFGVNFFLKDRLSIIVHPSYMAMYLSFAIWMIYKVEIPLFKSRKLKLVLYSLFILSIILLVSKAGIIILILIGGFMLYEMIFKHKKALKAISIVLLICMAFGSLFVFAPHFRYRFTNSFTAMTSKENNYTADESTGSRMAVWKASKEIIKQNFLIGTGTGSSNDALTESYKKDGMIVALKEHLNAHNQYLQTFITLGVFGLLWLLIVLFFPLQLAIAGKDMIYVGFLLIIIINIFVESMFETQAGVMFFAFFNAILFMNLLQKQKL